MFALLLLISSPKAFVPPAFSSLFSSVQKSEKIHYQSLQTQTRWPGKGGHVYITKSNRGRSSLSPALHNDFIDIH